MSISENRTQALNWLDQELQALEEQDDQLAHELAAVQASQAVVTRQKGVLIDILEAYKASPGQN